MCFGEPTVKFSFLGGFAGHSGGQSINKAQVNTLTISGTFEQRQIKNYY